MSYRQDVVDQITPLLPADWVVLPYSDEPDVLDRPTVMVTASEISPSRLASHYDITMHVYVLIPNHDDVAIDHDAVDDAVIETLDAVLRLVAVTQGTASRATFQGGSPCWDITINVIAKVNPA